MEVRHLKRPQRICFRADELLAAEIAAVGQQARLPRSATAYLLVHLGLCQLEYAFSHEEFWAAIAKLPVEVQAAALRQEVE